MAEEKRTILIVDDMEINRGILAEIFRTQYRILEEQNGKEAMTMIAANRDILAAVLLDIVMPEMDGYAVLENMGKIELLSRIPVLMITADTSPDAERTSYQKGAMDVISKPFDAVIVNQRVNRAIELYDHKNHLEDRVNEQTSVLRKQFMVLKKQEERLRETNSKIIDTICTIVEFRNLESGNHLKRIKGFTRIMAVTAMNMYPEYGLNEHRIDVITNASAMHDIGKITVPDSILLKPGRLTRDEFEVMKSHTTRGCEIVRMLSDIQDKEYFETSYDICRHHHEKYDGRGYPDGLKGEEISIAAQLTSIADVYDALISERVYKAAIPAGQAFDMIQSGECGAFSPKLLNCLTAAKMEMEALFRRNRDEDEDENDDSEDT